MLDIFNDIGYGDEEDEENNDESLEKNPYRHKTLATIFLVDARRNMLKEFDEGKSALVSCLKCIRNALRNKIFTEEKSYTGIILLGTKKAQNSLRLNNLTVIQELSAIAVEHILTIDKVMNALQSSSYEDMFGFDNYSLGDALWLALHTYNQRSQALNKRIILFTNDDGPAKSNDYRRVLSSAEDIHTSSIMFDVVQLGEDFDVNKYYKKLIDVSHHDMNYTTPDPVTDVNKMEKIIRETIYSHMPQARLPFVISDDFAIRVSVHFLVSKVKNPFKKKLSKATNDIVESIMELTEGETGSLVAKESIIKTQIVGERKINFDLGELREISECGKKELRLLGFKPITTVTVDNFIKPCGFLYPDDDFHKGSSIFFTALLKKCMEKEVVPICTFCPRNSSRCRFVALLAQMDTATNSSGIALPQGFIMFFLPFACEMRIDDDDDEDQPTPTKTAEPEQIELAMEIINKLKFKYKVERFRNPKLEAHWAAVEALALDLSDKEETVDRTRPNYDLMRSRLDGLDEDFIRAVYAENYDPTECNVERKRKSTVEVCPETIETLIRNGQGERLENAVLKAYLTSVGLGKGLSKVKKSELLQKVTEHLDIN